MKPIYIKVSLALLGITALLSLPFTHFSALADHSRFVMDYQPVFPAADFDFNLTMVGQYGGPSYAVAVEGDYLYFGVGPRMVIWSLSNPNAPAFLGQSAPLRDVVQGISIQGDYAYLACEQGGLRILNISDPSNPYEVGVWQIDGLPTKSLKVAVSGNFAYVVDHQRGLRVVNITNPSHPYEVGYYDGEFLSGFTFDVVVNGIYAYVANDYGLKIFDISVPSNPTPVDYDTYFGSGVAWALAYDSGHLYVARSASLDILSLGDPVAPVQVGSYTTEVYAIDVAVTGSYAYLVADGLEILDLTNLASPSRISQFATQQSVYRCPFEYPDSLKPCMNVAVAGDLAFVADDGYGLHALNLADPAQPYQVAGYSGVGRVSDVAVQGAFAYTTERDRGMHVINISNLQQLTLTGTFPLTGTLATVDVQGSYAYLGNGYPGYGGLYVLNVSNPLHPMQVAYLPEVGDPNHITAAGDYVYLTTGYEWTGFQIVDVRDPNNPIKAGEVIGDDMLAGGYDLALDGDRAYVADGGSVRILNVGDPYNPVHLGVYFPPEFYNYIYSVTTHSGLVYYTDAEDLAALDVTDPTSPTLAIEYGHAVSWGLDVETSGERTYVAAEGYGLKVLGLGSAYSGVETYLTPGVASQVEIVDNLVYVALNDGGLGIYAIGQFISNQIPASGGSLVLPDNSLSYTFPDWTFSSTVVVTHTVLLPNQVPTIPAHNISNGTAFSVEAAYRSNGLPAQPTSNYTVTLSYDPEVLGPIKEDTLGLYTWDGTAWQLESGPPDTANHTISATPDHFSYWVVMGETERLYLPMTPSRH